MKAHANYFLKRLCQGHFDHMCPYSVEIFWHPESIISFFPLNDFALRVVHFLFLARYKYI